MTGFGTLFIYSVRADDIDIPDLKEEDANQFLDTILDNVTASIDPAATAMYATGVQPRARILHLGTTFVRASAADYCPADYPLPEGVTASRMFIAAPQPSGTFPHADMTLHNLAATANDTAAGVGFTIVDDIKIAGDDFAATTEYSINGSDYIDMPAILPAYQAYDEFFQGNTSDADFFTDMDDEEELQVLESGFGNTEEAILDILKANIAANQSTASDIIDPSRVHILDYDLSSANHSMYLSDEIVNSVRSAVDAASSANVAVEMKVFGVTIYKGPAPADAGLFSGLKKKIGKVLKIGKVAVSAKLPTIKPPELKFSKPNWDKAINYGKGVVKAICSTPQTFKKTIWEPVKKKASNEIDKWKSKVKTYTAKVSNGVKNIAKEGAKLTTKAFKGTVGFMKKGFDFLKGLIPLILMILLIVGAVIGAVLLFTYGPVLLPKGSRN